MKKCLDCGSPWGETVFVWVPDTAWKRMGLSSSDYLCAHCVMDRMKEIAGYCYVAFGKLEPEKITACNMEISTRDTRVKPVYERR